MEKWSRDDRVGATTNTTTNDENENETVELTQENRHPFPKEDWSVQMMGARMEVRKGPSMRKEPHSARSNSKAFPIGSFDLLIVLLYTNTITNYK